MSVSDAQNNIEIREQRIFSALLAFGIAAPIISFQLGYIAFATIYVMCLLSRLKDGTVFVQNGYTKLFMLPLFALILLAISHRDVFSFEDSFTRTLELAGIFCVALMVADSVNHLVNRYGLQAEKFQKLVYSVFAVFTLAAVLKVAIDNDVPIAELHEFIRKNGIQPNLNFNHSDDTLVFATAGLAFAFLLAKPQTHLHMALSVMASILVLFYLWILINTSGAGTFIGIITGLLLISALVILKFAGVYWAKINSLKGLILIAALTIGGLIMLNQLAVFQENGRIYNALYQVTVLHQHEGAMPQLCSDDGNSFKRPIADLYKIDMPVTYRYFGYQTLTDIWLKEPFFGHGFYQKQMMISQLENSIPCIGVFLAHPHSLYFDILIRGGVFLLSVYLIFAGLIMVKLFRLFRKNANNLQTLDALLWVPLLFYLTFLAIENLVDLTFIFAGVLKAIVLAYTALLTLADYRSKDL